MDEWWNRDDLPLMFTCLRDRSSARKLRLFACACCQRIRRLVYPPWDAVLTAAEQHADDIITAAQLQSSLRDAGQPVHDATMAVEAAAMPDRWLLKQAEVSANYADQAVATEIAGEGADVPTWQAARGREDSAQSAILRDIFGNPFRPVAFDPSWHSSTAVALARQMYESRDFSGMPILADALQDAGCENDDILTHCRTPGTHVRGCWVVDLVLGKC